MAYHDHQGRGPTIGSEGYLPHPEGTTTETHHNELHHLPHLNDLFHNDNEGSNEANLTVNVDVGASCSPCSSTANAAAAAASSSSSSTVTDHTSGTDPVDVRIHAEDVCQAAMEGYDVMHSTAPTAATTTATATQTTAMTEGDGFVTAHQESSPASNKKRLLDGGSAASCNDSSNNPSAPNENINPNFNFNSDSNSNHPTMNNYGDDEDGESPVVQNNGHIDDEVERNENNTRNDETHYNKRARLSDVGGSGSGAEFESSSSSTTPSLLQQQHHHHGTEVFPHDSSEDLVGDGVATLSTEPNKKVNHEQWDTMFERLQVYKQQHGDCLVPKRYEVDPKLGTWVETQRVQYKRLNRMYDGEGQEISIQPNKRLDATRLHKLESIGFVWSAKHLRRTNTINYTDETNGVDCYSNTNVHIDVHDIDIDIGVGGASLGGDRNHPVTPAVDMIDQVENNNNINNMVYGVFAIGKPGEKGGQIMNESLMLQQEGREEEGQQQQQRQQEQDLLQRHHRLNEAHWEDMYSRLVQFKNENGHCLVPRKDENDPKLATWVETQRLLWNRDYKGKQSTLTTTVETDRNNTHTETTFDDESTPHSWLENNSQNGRKDGKGTTRQEAVDCQQESSTGLQETAATSQSALSADQRHYLQSHDGSDNNHEDDLYENNEMPYEYQAAESHYDTQAQPLPTAMPPSTAQQPHDCQEDGNNIVIAKPTPEYNKLKRLTPERKFKLDLLGFVWSLRTKRVEDHWDTMFGQLLQYKDEHGDCLVPSRYSVNPKLGKWVETQRYEYTKLHRMSATIPTTTQTDNNDSPNPAFWEEHYWSRSTDPPLGGEQSTADEKSGHGVELYQPTYFSQTTTTGQHESSDPPSMDSGVTRKVSGTSSSNPRLTEDRLRRLESIGFEWKVKHKMKRYYDKLWDSMFEELKAFKKVHGHCMVPKRYPPHIKLGTWVHTQRIQYRRLVDGNKTGAPMEDEDAISKSCEGEGSCRLSEERRRRLESIGFVWSAKDGEKMINKGGQITTRNPYDDQWEIMFEALRKYKEDHGHCLVPKRCTTFPKLGVDTQRVQFKKLQKLLSERGKMVLEEGDCLESGSSTMGQRDEEHNDASKTAVLASTEAHEVVPKLMIGRLTDDRIRRLEELGFVWSLRDDWHKHYEELKEYRASHGNCNVPARYAANRRLGMWVSAQRQQFKMMHQLSSDPANARPSATLTPERIELLNQIGFTWTIRSRDSFGASWYQRLEELRAFKAKNGHTLVPARYADSPELGIWVGTQRTQYRLYMKARETGTEISGPTAMNEIRIKELEGLGFVWALRSVGKDDSEAFIADAPPDIARRLDHSSNLSTSTGTYTERQGDSRRKA